MEQSGVEVSPLASANCGWGIDWPANIVEGIEGQAIKNIVASVGDQAVPGEVMLTRYGMEGGPIYALGPALRDMAKGGDPAITLDLKPTFSVEQLVGKMESAKKNFLAESQQRWKLNEPMRLLLDFCHGPFDSAEALAAHTKACRVPLSSPRPLDEAISSAGGVAWKAIDDQLMVRELPGVFVAGEMIDWEAPTGGYLLQGCFATGSLAAEAALGFVGEGS